MHPYYTDHKVGDLVCFPLKCSLQCPMLRVTKCDLAEGLEGNKSLCMQRGNACAGICWLHGSFSVSHLIKSYSCFHLLSKTIKMVEEERNRPFLFDWHIYFRKLLGLEQLQEEKKKKKWPNLRLITFSFLIPGFSFWVPKLTLIVLFHWKNQIQAAVWLVKIS